MAALFGLLMLAGGIYLFENHMDHDLPYKYRALFGSTKNAAVFIGLTGTLLAFFGIRRVLNSQTGIVFNEDGFMDHRFLKSPIPWRNITNFHTTQTTVMGQEMEVLLLAMQPNTKSDARFNWIYKYNNWIKSKDENIIAINLHGMEEQDGYDLHQAFGYWINRYPGGHRSRSQRITPNGAQSSGFGRRVR